MAMYRSPQARAQILEGEPTPEKTEIASRILATDGGLPQALENMEREAAPPVQMAQAVPAPNQAPQLPDMLPEDFQRHMLQEIERRSGWLIINEGETVPWDKNITWGQYLRGVLENQGGDARDAIIDQQMLLEEQRREPPEGPKEFPMPVLPSMPQPDPNQQLMAGAPPGLAPPAPPPAEQGGVMMAANGGLVGFANGGMRDAYALGGIVEASQGAPVGEDEFMRVISQLSGEAGIPEGQLDAVAEMATQTAGAPAAGAPAAGAPAAANDNVMDSGIMQTVEAVETEESDLLGVGSLTEISDRLVAAGKEPLIHASPGEIVFDPTVLPENERGMLFAALNAAGIDPARVTVGNDLMELNELTGLPAAGLGSFFKKVFRPIKRAVKKVGKFLKKNAGTILGIAGAMTGNPWLAALGSGIGSLIEGKPIQSALLSAGMSFAGTKWVGPWIGKQLQGIGSLGIGESMQTPLGTALGSAGIGGPGGVIATQTATGVAQTAAQNAGAAAATNAAINAGTDLSREAVLNLAQTAASDAITATVGTGLVPAAIEKGASQIAQTAVNDVLAGTVTKVAGMAIPERVLTSAVPRLFSQPIGNLIGGAVAGAGQMIAEPYLESMVSGVPAEDEQAVIDAFNAQYNYTPTSDELYTFYTDQYVPNQQVNVAQTIGGIPGYTAPGSGVTLAAGGGYINGVGGPKSDSNLARLSNGEFVMTEAAVRGAGYGDRIAGAKRMYNIMNGLERRVA